jgi:geranylgeranyl diphosphate synthase type II
MPHPDSRKSGLSAEYLIIIKTMKDAFETYLKVKSDFYFQEKSSLTEAIQYSLLAPGKRVRPLLCLGFAQGFGGNLEVAFASGMAVEMIHAYSLIHDDLPAMDNDDYRRGRLTNHKVFGEATAILAGDSLLNFAPEFLQNELLAQNIDPAKILEITSLLLKASGHAGMVKGQALDMKFENEDLTKYDKKELDSILREIHKLKTGSIITWSCIAGLYAHSDSEIIKKYKCQVESIGQRIGLLFQMVDDVQDTTATLAEIGKTPGKDEKMGKLTYTNLHGVAGATKLAKDLAIDIRQDLEELAALKGDWSLILQILKGIEARLP